MERRRDRIRKRVGRAAVDQAFGSLGRIGDWVPMLKPERHGVERIRDQHYGTLPTQRLDVFRPRQRSGPLPIVLYAHGGGFRILSKDTHAFMGLAFARRGYLVFNVEYRLAPEHRFPAALTDMCEAFEWVVDNARRFGGDISRIALAGESAGGNLVTSLAIATSWERPEPWARRVWATGVTPRLVLPACPLLQVSDPGRFHRAKPLPPWLRDRVEEVAGWYLPLDDTPIDLADPICVLEQAGPPARPLPPFFVPVGTADPILDDTRRLARALEGLGVPCDARYYPGEIHAFHALLWRANARKCWREMLDFTDRHL